MPPVDANGEVDPSAIPDFVAVAGRDVAIVGYVRKEATLDTRDVTWPVYAADLRTVVGHLLPGKGFVPLGVDPATVPNVPINAGPPEVVAPVGPQGGVLVYVRNASSDIAWIAVQVGGAYEDDGGYWGGGYVGAGCFAMPAGSRLVVVDGDPAKPPAPPSTVVYIQGSQEVRAERHVNIDADAQVTVGEGMPPWWQGAPPC